MYVAGPIQTPEEANAVEQAAFLWDLRLRMRVDKRRSGHRPAPAPRQGTQRRMALPALDERASPRATMRAD